MCLTKLPGGDALRREGDALLLTFAGKRRVLSTSAACGGVREDLTAVFNYDLSRGKTARCEMLAPTQAGHMRAVARMLGLEEGRVTGLCTAAQVANAAIVGEEWGGTTVTAIVTAGVDENACRAGDPASWQESEGALGLPVGTINLLLHIGADLDAGALATALITATEAKCAALQELRLPSLYSSGLATGSGTDGAVLVAIPGAHTLTDAGKHSKLGELVGRAVHAAVRRALFLQTGADARRLQNPERHLARWRLPPQELAAFSDKPVEAALTAHLLDLEAWGVFTREQTAPLLDKIKGQG